MKKLTLAFALLALAVIAVGCTNSGTTTADGKNETEKKSVGKDEHEGHDHAAEVHKPPHGGHLIELGRNHEYHAELLDDHKSESVTVYIMDGHMKPLTIQEPSISLVLTADSETKTFELTGATPPGGSSEFTSSDEAMMTMIEKEGVTGKLRVNIDGKPFTGTFDHEGHDH
jgi:hypothetical protein